MPKKKPVRMTVHRLTRLREQDSRLLNPPDQTLDWRLVTTEVLRVAEDAKGITIIMCATWQLNDPVRDALPVTVTKGEG